MGGTQTDAIGTSPTANALNRLAGLSSSVALKGPCVARSTTNVTLSGEQTVGGVAVVTGDRVLLMGQTDAKENGIWYVSTGAWSRAPDFSRNDDVVQGTMIYVVGVGLFVVTAADPIVFDTTSITIESATALVAGALLAANNLSDLSSVMSGWDTLLPPLGSAVSPVAGVLTITRAAMTSPLMDLGAGAITSVVGETGTLPRQVRLFRCAGTTTITLSATLQADGRASGVATYVAGQMLMLVKYGNGDVFVWSIGDNGGQTKGADVASSPTVVLAPGKVQHITGTTTITDVDFLPAFDGAAAWVVFDGALTLTYNATTLKLPGATDITTAAGDRALFVQDSNDNVICLDYIRANGNAIVGSSVTSGQTLATFFPRSNEPPSSNYATLSVRNGHPILVFPDAVVYVAVFTGILPASYGGGGLTVEIEWMCSTTSTNKVCFGGYIERMDVGSTDYDSDSYASEQIDTTGVAANATSGITSKTTLTFTSGANMDSLAAGDTFRLKIARETGQANDTNTGDIQVVAVRVKET